MKQNSTPLRKAWDSRLAQIDNSVRYTDTAKLEIGDYAMIKTDIGKYFGFISSIGRVNVKITTPYGGWADTDFIDMQELKFKKCQVILFAKPFKTA